MNDPVDRLIAERIALDRGVSRGLVLSVAGHLLLVGGALAAPLLMPKKPLITVAPAFAVSVPRGGGGPVAPPSAKVEAPKAEPPKKKEIIKPPTPEEKKGLPMPGAKKQKAAPTSAPASTGSTGKTLEFQGLGIGPAGVGVPEGTEGDLYMGGVLMKIARVWRGQIRPEIKVPVIIRFTIMADGSITEVQVVQSSGVYLLDSGARSSVATAAPFSPLPRHYDTQFCNASRCTLQVRFTN